MRKVSWGVISTARIGVEKVIPAMQKGKYSVINAIASRDYERASKAAKELGIPKAYGSYEELLADKEIDAVYISLPNHLHSELTIKSLQAGKHVLCEKPITLNYNDALHLQETAKKFPDLKLMEAFMYRHHPQWKKIKELIKAGEIGELKSTNAVFTFYNDNPADIRNQADIGGGALLDIGCYCISVSRFIFESEPKRVSSTIEYDPKMKIDRLVSGVLEFEKGTSTFTCSTQINFYAKVEILGSHGRIEIEKPFTPEADKTSRVIFHNRSEVKEFIFEPVNQYTLQGDLFSLAILNNTDVPTPFEDAVANMKVIEGVINNSKNKS